ncbi:hypothetical protein [Streptomyces sp. NPDC057702]|uniref:hypothetical protein n=1 Tax=unclassified Streptomyces TaxID=2593676 RepID=UPI00369D8CD8
MGHEKSEVERVLAAWRTLTDWLAEHAPTSHASILPPASERELADADRTLNSALGFGLPSEMVALWSLAGGTRHVDIDALDEQGEVHTGRFLPGGVLLSPGVSVGPRLHFGAACDANYAGPWVAFLGNDEEAPDLGRYAGARGVGGWQTYEGGDAGSPVWPSVAAYLEAVNRALTEGPADLLGPDLPGLVYGCLVWEDPANPAMTQALEDWRPLR